MLRHPGLVHIIREDPGDNRFLIRNNHTGEETTGFVDPGKQELFRDQCIFSAVPHTCPFFRHQRGIPKAYCAVQLTCPDSCREY